MTQSLRQKCLHVMIIIVTTIMFSMSYTCNPKILKNILQEKQIKFWLMKILSHTMLWDLVTEKSHLRIIDEKEILRNWRIAQNHSRILINNLVIPKLPFCISFKDDEYQNLSENMKSVGKGKKIFTSNSTLSTVKPSSNFNITSDSDQDTKRSKRQSTGCSIRVDYFYLVLYY